MFYAATLLIGLALLSLLILVEGYRRLTREMDQMVARTVRTITRPNKATTKPSYQLTREELANLKKP